MRCEQKGTEGITSTAVNVVWQDTNALQRRLVALLLLGNTDRGRPFSAAAALAGAALTLAEATRGAVDAHGPPDVVLVSGMGDRARWLGLTRRFLGDPAIVLYLHENQLMYPLSPNQKADDEHPLANWMSMVAADEVWCNSAFQRDGLLEALPALLGRAPDRSHISHLPEVARRAGRSTGAGSARHVHASCAWLLPPGFQ